MAFSVLDTVTTDAQSETSWPMLSQQQLLKTILFTVVCSSKLQYQPQLWNAFKEVLNNNI